MRKQWHWAMVWKLSNKYLVMMMVGKVLSKSVCSVGTWLKLKHGNGELGGGRWRRWWKDIRSAFLTNCVPPIVSAAAIVSFFIQKKIYIFWAGNNSLMSVTQDQQQHDQQQEQRPDGLVLDNRGLGFSDVRSSGVSWRLGFGFFWHAGSIFGRLGFVLTLTPNPECLNPERPNPERLKPECLSVGSKACPTN